MDSKNLYGGKIGKMVCFFSRSCASHGRERDPRMHERSWPKLDFAKKEKRATLPAYGLLLLRSPPQRGSVESACDDSQPTEQS